MRVDRLVVPAPKSSFSSRSTRRPARAHSRAIATPLIPPPITTISNRVGSGGRGVGPGTNDWMQVAVPEDNCAEFHESERFGGSCGPVSGDVQYTVAMTTGERFERAVAIMH